MFVTAIGSWIDLTTVVVMAGHQYLLFSLLWAYGRSVPACPTELMHGELTCSGHWNMSGNDMWHFRVGTLKVMQVMHSFPLLPKSSQKVLHQLYPGLKKAKDKLYLTHHGQVSWWIKYLNCLNPLSCSSFIVVTTVKPSTVWLIHILAHFFTHEVWIPS